MVRKIFIWGIVLIALFIWFTQVFKSCGNTNTIGNADTTIENSVGELSSNDNEFEGEDEEADNNSSEGKGEGDEPDAYDKEGEEEQDESSNSQEEGTSTSENAETSSPNTATTNNTNTSPSAQPASNSSSKGPYIVVGGTFNNKSYAETEIRRLKRMGYNDAELFRFDYSDFYSVSVGRYNRYRDANARATSLKKDGIENYVHKMRTK